jgi:hypothetical protein
VCAKAVAEIISVNSALTTNRDADQSVNCECFMETSVRENELDQGIVAVLGRIGDLSLLCQIVADDMLLIKSTRFSSALDLL